MRSFPIPLQHPQFLETNTAVPDVTGLVSVSTPGTDGRFTLSGLAVVQATPISATTGSLSGPYVRGSTATVSVFGHPVTVPVGIIQTSEVPA